MRAPIVIGVEALPILQVQSGRAIAVQKPPAGSSAGIQLSPGETLDLSQIANDNLTLVKLGQRLVVLFPDRSYVVIDGLYLPDGNPTSSVKVAVDPGTSMEMSQFAAQFPIGSDEQVLTAAGVNVGPRGSGGVNLASAPPSSALTPVPGLTPGDEGGGSAFAALPDDPVPATTDATTAANGGPVIQSAALQAADAPATAINGPPTLDLDSGAAGTGYAGLVAAEAARSTGIVVAANGVSIAQTTEGAPDPRPNAVAIGDPDTGDRVSSITVDVGAVASGQAGVLVLSDDAAASLASIGSIAGSGTGTLVLTSAGGFTQAQAQALIAGVRYVNTEQSFALDIADRRIDVTIRDLSGASATASASIPVIASVSDTGGLDSFTGTRFDDVIRGLGGADIIRAGDGDDLILYGAGDGNDILLDGGSGTDTFAIVGDDLANLFRFQTSGGVLTQFSIDGASLGAIPTLTNIERTIADGLGSLGDTIDYSGNAEAVAVDLAAGTASGLQAIASFENIVGGLGNDVLTGDAQANRIEGGFGDDVINGGAGDNRLIGGEGDDRITALGGADIIDGGAGDNRIDAGEGANVITVGDGDNTIRAGAGADTLTVGNGDNDIDLGNGDNVLTVGSGTNTIVTGSGADLITVGDGTNTIASGAGNDTINLGRGDNTVTTGAGDDTLVFGNDLSSLGVAILRDFQAGSDTLQFSTAAVGAGLAQGGADTGELDASRFVAGADFTNTDQRFLFDTTTNLLSYDADGSGAGAVAVAIAQFEAGLSVGAGDIRIA